MDIPYIKCVLEELCKTHSQNSQPTKVVRYFKYISPIKLITKYCIHVFCKQFSVALETVHPNFCMLNGLPKSKYPTEMLYFLVEHT